MKDLSAYYEIARLITAELSETITPEEKERLNVWLAEDERHYMRYCRIRERLKRGEGENVFRNPERVREDMEKLKKKLSGNKRRFLLSGNYFWRYGAVAVFTIGIAIGLIERPWEDRSSEMSPMAQQPAVLPGSYKAVLTLASGEQVNLEEWCRDSLWKDGTLIRKRKGELTYEQKAGDMQQEEMLFNTITIPRSGEYKLVLSDGTKVWLNAESQLSYPDTFRSDERRVILKGEAYFQVAHNEEKPFYVESDGQLVRVYGTEFNIRSYEEDAAVYTTLISGSVALQVAGNLNAELFLTPGRQAVFDKKEASAFVRSVNTEVVTGWRKGLFVFEEQNLGQIMATLARWYNFDYEFADNVLSETVFMGSVPRYGDFNEVLEILEKSGGLKFRLENHTVIISHR